MYTWLLCAFLYLCVCASHDAGVGGVVFVVGGGEAVVVAVNACVCVFEALTGLFIALSPHTPHTTGKLPSRLRAP